MLTTDIERYTSKMDRNPPAEESSIRKVESELVIKFADDYIEFLSMYNGAEGAIGNAYLGLWEVERIIPENIGYEVKKFYPGYLFFATNYGGTFYAFDTRVEPYTVVEVPVPGDVNEIVPICDSFIGFLTHLFNCEEAMG